MLKKSNSFWKYILLIISLLLYISIEIQTPNIVKAQETKEDKCVKFFETQAKTLEALQKTYSECIGVPIAEQYVPTEVERFGITNLEYEWARLDMLSTMLDNDPKLIAYIVIYGGKTNKYGELKERPKPLIHYLTNKKGIDPKRIKIIEGGFREKFEFEFWTSQSEKMFPPLSPTVEPEKVIFRGKMKPLPVDF